MNQPSAERIRWIHSVPFFAVHLAALSVLWVPFQWKWVALCIGLYYARMFGITAGYHRYFAHRTYKTSRWFQFCLAFLGSTALQKGVLWWAAHHRHHHRHSDKPTDVHSPIQRGFWYSHVGWILVDTHEDTRWNLVKDLTRFPELVFLDRFHLLPPILVGILIFLLGGFPALAWGGFLSTTLLWHGTFTINSLSHVFGKRRYQTTDTSRNNWILALITMGEGWHNNHHTFMASTRQGFYWWEVDASYWTLKVLSWFGIVWDLREPDFEWLEGRRLDRELRPEIMLNVPQVHVSK